MFCKNCGSQIDDKAVICPKCGVATGKTSEAADDAPNGGFTALSFFFPLIGIILFFYWRNDYPERAGSCINGVLIGVIIQVVSMALILICFQDVLSKLQLLYNYFVN